MGFLRRLLKGIPRLDGGARWRAYAGLRSMVLGIDQAKLGDRVVQLPNVLGVVVDWSLGEDFATFVALADGTASMYTSAGGGTIGAGGRPGIDTAGAVLLRSGRGTRRPVRSRSRPRVVRIRAGSRTGCSTRTGLRAVDHPAEGPPPGDVGLAALGDAFQEYVTQFRLLDESGS